MEPHLEEAWRALRLADRDIQAFSVLKAAPDVHPSIICFHVQQAIEKLLKAVLFTHLIEFRRTHNLVDLAVLLRQNSIAVPLADEKLARLNPFAVTFRYDDIDIGLFTPEEATAWVTTIRAWAEAQVRSVAADEKKYGTNDD